MSVKQKVIDARKAIREKLRLLRLGYLERDQSLRETFKPITESLGQLSTKIQVDRDAISDFIGRHSDAMVDKIYGVSRTKPYMLGTQPISLTDTAIHVGEREFQRTPGLQKLIFLKHVKGETYNPHDLQMYGEILNLTGTHRTAKGEVKSPTSMKYRNVIKPIMDVEESRGDGISIQHKTVTNQTPQYIYYDDPNELIERLRLLIASSDAGNTAHSNEVASIISELRERGIIE